MAILDRRLVKKGSSATQQILVQWSTLTKDCTTWEDHSVLRNRFPEAVIWEPAASQGGANVTSSPSSALTMDKEDETQALRKRRMTTEGPHDERDRKKEVCV